MSFHSTSTYLKVKLQTQKTSCIKLTIFNSQPLKPKKQKSKHLQLEYALLPLVLHHLLMESIRCVLKHVSID
jgi:hypothetical protein